MINILLFLTEKRRLFVNTYSKTYKSFCQLKLQTVIIYEVEIIDFNNSYGEVLFNFLQKSLVSYDVLKIGRKRMTLRQCSGVQ